MSMNIVLIQDVEENTNDLDDEERYIINEFKIYKESTLQSKDIGNYPTPNEESTQKKEYSEHPFFGRDRVFDYPKRLLAKIWAENLTHVHIDTDGEWDEPKYQWFTTSKNALIYSAFKKESEIIFVIHEILKDFPETDDEGAHKFYKSEYIEELLTISEWHRNNYPHKKQNFI